MDTDAVTLVGLLSGMFRISGNSLIVSWRIVKVGTVPPGVDSCVSSDQNSPCGRNSRDGAGAVFFGGCSAADES